MIDVTAVASRYRVALAHLGLMLEEFQPGGFAIKGDGLGLLLGLGAHRPHLGVLEGPVRRDPDLDDEVVRRIVNDVNGRVLGARIVVTVDGEYFVIQMPLIVAASDTLPDPILLRAVLPRAISMVGSALEVLTETLEFDAIVRASGLPTG